MKTRLIALLCILGAIAVSPVQGIWGLKKLSSFLLESKAPQTTCVVNAPTNLSVSEQTTNSLKISWTAATESGGGCSGNIQYKILGIPVFANPSGPYTTKTGKTSQKFSGLTPFTTYTLSIIAIDGQSQSNPPAFLEVQTKPNKYYLQLSVPPATPQLQFPVYVYQKKGSQLTQIDYIQNQNITPIIGECKPTSDQKSCGANHASYYLYFQNANNAWFACRIVVNITGINAAQTTCPGTVINYPPPSLDPNYPNFFSNVVNIAPGANLWPPPTWDPKTVPYIPPNPTNPNNAMRTITFVNNTSYSNIVIGEKCTGGASGGPITPPGPLSCLNTTQLTQVKQGVSATFNIPAAGLNADYYVTQYQLPSGSWVDTGSVNGIDYANQMEANIPATDSGTVTFIDLSAVDGFNIGMEYYVNPTTPAYCTFTSGNEFTNIAGAEYFKSSSGGHGNYTGNPIGSLTVINNSSLEDFCKMGNETVTIDGQTLNLNLTHYDANGNFKGCFSPKTFTQIYPPSQNTADIQNKYGCAGSYGSATTCLPIYPGASNSAYVRTMEANFPRIYTFQYDDYRGTITCPTSTSFVIVFTDLSATPPSQTCTVSIPGTNGGIATSNYATNGNTTSATVTWNAATSSGSCSINPSKAVYNYNLKITDPNGTIIFNNSVGTATSQALPDLQQNTTYTVTVTPSVQNEQANSVPATNHFTTPIFSAPTNVAASDQSSSPTITWNAPSTDTFITSGAPTFDYDISLSDTVNPNNSKEYNKIKGTQLPVSGLVIGDTYSVTVTAHDNQNNTSSASQPYQLTILPPTPSSCAISTPTNLSSSNITTDSATVAWDASSETGGACTGNITYQVTAPPSNFSQDTDNTSQIITGLAPNTTYTATVIAQDGSYQSSPATLSVPTSSICTVNPPTNLSTSNITTDSATVAWDASSETGGACTGNITYQVTAPPSNFSQDTDNTSQIITGLAPNTTYTATVIAQDESYQSSPATLPIQTNSLPPPPPPPTCTINSPSSAPIGTLSNANQTVLVSWNTPTSSASCDSPNYTYTVALNPAATPAEYQGSNTSTTFTGLTPSTAYTINVTAQASNWPNAITYPAGTFTTPAAAPPAVLPPTITASWESRAKINVTSCTPDPTQPNATCSWTVSSPDRGTVQTIQGNTIFVSTGHTYVISATATDNGATSSPVSVTCSPPGTAGKTCN